MAKRSMLGEIAKTMTDAASAATEAVIGAMEAPFVTKAPPKRRGTGDVAKKPTAKRGVRSAGKSAQTALPATSKRAASANPKQRISKRGHVQKKRTAKRAINVSNVT